jgi:predicted RNA binding protein YcfA (HicA-like mRNA interferase family)
MSKKNKLIDRLLLTPQDFTWDELGTILTSFGYREMKTGKTGGSRRQFVDADKNIITLHKPHPGKILKEYALKQVVEHLKDKGKITDE